MPVPTNHATAPAATLVLNRLATILQRYSFRYATEAQLHRGIAEALTAEGIAFEHERIDGPNRYDFYCGGIVLEVKMDRSASEAHRQIDRYCQAPDVVAVILVTTKTWYAQQLFRTTCRDRPVLFVRIRGQAF